MHCKYFFPVCGLLLFFVYSIFCNIDILKFDAVKFSVWFEFFMTYFKNPFLILDHKFFDIFLPIA